MVLETKGWKHNDPTYHDSHDPAENHLLFYSTEGSSGRLQPAVEKQPLSGLGRHSCCEGED